MNYRVDRLIETGWRGWTKLLAIWTIPGLLATIALFLPYQNQGQLIGFVALFLTEVWVWYFWALITPTLYRITVRFPLKTRTWVRSTLVHILCIVLCTTLISLGYMVIPTFRHDQMPGLHLTMRISTFDAYVVGRYFAHFLTYCIVVGVLTFVYEHRLRQKRERESVEQELRASRLETQLNQAKLQSLRAQLHPHFLFNSLNSLAALIAHQETNDAYKMVTCLARLLRASLDEIDRGMIPLQKEVEFIEQYLKIERIRFEDRLQTNITIAPNCRDIPVPFLILLPLVENCIRHSVARKTDSTLVDVQARRTADRLTVKVCDNGPGMPQGWSPHQGTGIGIRNVQERLRVEYGGHEEFVVEPREPTGTCIRISIPLQSESEEAVQ